MTVKAKNQRTVKQKAFTIAASLSLMAADYAACLGSHRN